MTPRPITICLGLTWVIATGMACSRTPVVNEARLALVGATVIPGDGSEAIADATVLVEKGTIVTVGPRGEVDVPTDSRVLDLSGKYLVPGLIDTHAHIRAGQMRDTVDGQPRIHHDFNPLVMRQVLRMMLAYGVTTIRNPASAAEVMIPLRDSIAAGQVVGPRVLTAGRGIGFAPIPFVSVGVVVSTAAEARELVRRQAIAGVDLIKVMWTLPPTAVRAVVDEAHAQGLPVMGHLGATTWTEAAEAGVDFITHATPDSPALLPGPARALYARATEFVTWWELVDLDGPEMQALVATMVEAGVGYDPNLVADEAVFWGDDPRFAGDPDLALVPTVLREEWEARARATAPTFRQRGRKIWPKVLELTRRLHDAGVRVTASTDTPNSWLIPGKSLHRELELLVDAGMTPAEVLTAATWSGAEALGITDQVGAIRVGLRADLVVLLEDPLEEIGNTRTIESVIQGGHVFKPSELLR